MIEVRALGTLVRVDSEGPEVVLRVNTVPIFGLPPAEARQIGNALLEAADECEGMRR